MKTKAQIDSNQCRYMHVIIPSITQIIFYELAPFQVEFLEQEILFSHQIIATLQQKNKMF